MPVDHAAEIAHLERLLNSGVRSGSVDGQQTELDLAEVRRRLSELKRLQEGSTYSRPKNAGIDLRRV
jgi:hypothetical protein